MVTPVVEIMGDIVTVTRPSVAPAPISENGTAHVVESAAKAQCAEHIRAPVQECA
jgi:hypothetical protein